MKKLFSILLISTLSLSLLAGCGGKTDEKIIVVGASPTPHAEILNAAKAEVEKLGYTLEVKEFSDYVLPNTALNDGELDANYFQHTPYLNTFNRENDTSLVVASELHYEPFGVYPGKTATLDALPEGASVAIPNDGSNETRALLLLQDVGLITLKDGIDPTSDATILDIVENPKDLTINEIAAEQLTRALEDVDIAVINGNHALSAGLNANDNAIATEKEEYGTTYVNVLAVQKGSESSDKTKALVAALESASVRAFIEDTYKGAVVPTF